MADKPWHTGPYKTQAAAVRAYAYANPMTRCRRCQLTLGEIRATKPKTKWHAGHLVDGQIGGQLAPECSNCNQSAGGRLGRARQLNKPRNALNW